MSQSAFEMPIASAQPARASSEQTALLERLLASSQLRRAARLRDLLLFLSQHSGYEGAAPIHEQEIGAAVFDRPRSYDTGVDNIVRVNVTELRKRLDIYFSSEGAREPVIIEIPRGSYTLQFRQRAAVVEPVELPVLVAPEPVSISPVAEEAVTATDVAPAASHRAWITRLLTAVSAVFLLAIAVLLWQNLRLRDQVSPWRSGAALRAFWSPFFEGGQASDIVLADTSFAISQDIERRSIPLASYLNYDYKRLDALTGLSPDRREDLRYVLDRNNGSVGDYIVAEHILALDPTAATLHLNFAREYSAETLKTNAAILIGSRQSNPWVELFDSRMNFWMDYDPVLHQASIRNRQPKPGEKAVYTPAGAAHEAGLSVIAFMPGLSHSGSALILEGTNSQATRAAGEFITNDASLSGFLAQIKGKDFPYFEILLENTELTGTPLRSHILAYRLYPRDKSGNP